MTDVTGTTSYAYDSAGRLKSKSTPYGALAYTYDVAGNVLAVRSSNSNGVSADYSYDELHRLSAVRDTRSAATAASYTYGANGALASALYANGVRTGYTYDALDRLTNVSAEAGGAPLASYSYTLGAAGNRLSVTEAGGRTVGYTYDALYRLTEERIGGGAAAGGVVTYTYDAVGNLIARAGSTPNEHLFAGERFDAETGMYYLRARFLQPNSGRFWSMDSYAGDSFDPPSLHKYTYTRNDPVDFIDPSGNKEITLAGTLKTLVIVNVMTVALTHGLTYIAHGRLANSEEMWKALAASNAIALFMLFGPVFLAPKLGVSSAFFTYVSSGALTTIFTILGLKDMANAKTDRQRAAASLGLLISVVLGYYGLRAGSKSPAHAYADEVRATYEGPKRDRPATVTQVEVPGAKDFRGRSRGRLGIPEDLHPEMAKALDSVPEGIRQPCHGTCAEIVAINEMLNKGINPKGTVATTAKVRDPTKMIKGTNKPEHGMTHPRVRRAPRFWTTSMSATVSSEACRRLAD